jgi:hypothetical protein
MIKAYNYAIMCRIRIQSTWQWLLAIFTLASLIETIFYSQMLAFTPLYLPQLGVSDEGQILLLAGVEAHLIGILHLVALVANGLP